MSVGAAWLADVASVPETGAVDVGAVDENERATRYSRSLVRSVIEFLS